MSDTDTFPKDTKCPILVSNKSSPYKRHIEDIMEIKETDARASGDSVMLQDAEYYKYIFKKTEKICLAVFYILRTDSDTEHKDSVVSDLEDASRTLLDTALVSLDTPKTSLDAVMRELRFALVALESYLRIAHVSRHLSAQHLEVFVREIASLQRGLRAYTDRGSVNPFDATESEPLRERKVVRPATLGTLPRPITQAVAGERSRKDRIIDILKDKGSATIKDITDVVIDCSEKTVQRELIALIKDGKVHREGERRWSKYSVL